MPCQTWQTEILCYIMSVVFEKTPSVFLRSAVVVLRCSSSLFAIKHPPLFHFGGQRVIFSFPAPYNTACNSVIFKISRLNAAAVLAFKSICNDPSIPHSPAYANASAVKHRAGVICPVGTNAAYFERFPVIVISAHGSAANRNAYKLSFFIRKPKRKFAACRFTWMFSVVLGDSELESQTAELKNMQTLL